MENELENGVSNFFSPQFLILKYFKVSVYLLKTPLDRLIIRAGACVRVLVFVRVFFFKRSHFPSPPKMEAPQATADEDRSTARQMTSNHVTRQAPPAAHAPNVVPGNSATARALRLLWEPCH